MSVAEMKDEMSTLSEEERHELSAHLAFLALDSEKEFWNTVERRSDDKEQSHWIGLEELENGES